MRRTLPSALNKVLAFSASYLLPAIALLLCAISSSSSAQDSSGNVVKGRVLFTGKIPVRKEIGESDPVCASAAEIEGRYKSEVSVRDGGLANVMIYFTYGLENRQFVPPSDTPIVHQDQCVYKPHVVGVMVGQSVLFRNDDKTLHNVHGTPKKNEQFNFAQAVKGKENLIVFDKEELMIPVYCDVHGWQRAFIGVFSHPYFAVTDSSGSFSIQGLPPGSYTLSAWHEKLGTQEQTIVVEPTRTSEISFTYKSE